MALIRILFYIKEKLLTVDKPFDTGRLSIPSYNLSSQCQLLSVLHNQLLMHTPIELWVFSLISFPHSDISPSYCMEDRIEVIYHYIDGLNDKCLPMAKMAMLAM